MPAKNSLKNYIENGHYHIYNRGVEKRPIFLDEQDCRVFLRYLKLYLSPREELLQLQKENPGARIQRFIPLNMSDDIDLLSFAIMPNHIHLHVKQHIKDGIIKFMRRVSTSYVMYFNRKYERVGVLFQGRYKAVLIETEAYNLHLSRYIHLNPVRLTQTPVPFLKYSSYEYYLGTKKASWVKPQTILNSFKTAQIRDLPDILSYKSFVEEYSVDSQKVISELLSDEN